MNIAEIVLELDNAFRVLQTNPAADKTAVVGVYSLLLRDLRAEGDTVIHNYFVDKIDRYMGWTK